MFSRDDTKALKGLAALMMLFHHLVGFTDRYPPDFEGFQTLWRGFAERGLLSTLAGFCNNCVSIFFFLGGYGMYLLWKDKRFHLGKQIKRLYLAYWRVFVLIIPVALIFFRRSLDQAPVLCCIYNISDARQMFLTLLANFTGINSTLNYEWWFFKSYLCMMPMGVLFCLAMKKTNHPAADFLIVCMIDFVRRAVFTNIGNTTLFAGAQNHFFFSVFLIPDIRATMLYLGIVFAKHDLLVRMKNIFIRLRFSPVYGLAVIVGIFYMRSFLTAEFIDIIYVPLFIAAASVILDSIPLLKEGAVFFGQHSTNFWLLHTFFCYYFYETTRIVYSTRSPLMDWLILLAFTLGASLLVEIFWNLIGFAEPTLRRLIFKPQTQETEAAAKSE
ncbi:MAG: acyltransferase [Oscillospiraceae bacterium]|nr:acyltransferase [Oscillospiraceae bacterium]